MLTVKSVADLNHCIATNIHKLNRKDYDVVVGIPRSGMLPASIIATLLQLPLADVESYRQGRVWGRSGHIEGAGDRVLLVDDTSNKGGAMAAAVARIKRASKITRFAVYGPYRDDYSIIDLFFEIVPGPRAFEWNFAKHARLPRWGFDIDGVLCRDPTREENDRGENYDVFIRDVPQLFRPLRPLGIIVTCRQERYRPQTERWLASHGISYKHLVMSPKTRPQGSKGLWKAAMIRELAFSKDTRIEFFMESELKQARQIADTCKIPVWCSKTCEVIHA